MEIARQHWKIMQKMPKELDNIVREFMVIGDKGDGVLLVKKNRRVYWYGEMKFGESSKKAIVATRLNVPKLASIAQGYEHILLLDENGQIHAMGKNIEGQLGQGTVDMIIRFSTRPISSSHKFSSIRCGTWHSLTLTNDGKVWTWADKNCGQNRLSTVAVRLTRTHLLLHQVSELDSHRVVAIECGGWHSLALTDQGEVYAWGTNASGQLGNNDEEQFGCSGKHLHSLSQIPIPSPVQSIAAGRSHTLLLTQTGEVYACGENKSGQLGIPTTTESSASLVKVDGLPVISQIASHFHADLSLAMTAKRKCFAWGHLGNQTFTSTPHQFPSIYSTLDSVLSFRSTQCNTPQSVRVEGLEDSKQTPPTKPTKSESGSKRLGDRMLDNPDSNPDVKFELGEQIILAHRSVLQISSSHFNQLFSKLLNPIFQSIPSTSQRTTNPSEHDIHINTTPLITISIPDQSYPIFQAYIRFLYTGTLQVPAENLANLFELAHSYLESDLEQLCLTRMRDSVSLENCCIFYQLTERHSLPEFQLELLHFIAVNILQVFSTTAYQSMNGDLCKKLALSIAILQL